MTNNTLSGGVETSNFFRSVRFRKNNGEIAFYKRFAAINGNSVMVDGTTAAPDFQLVETSAVTSAITSASTDSEIPSAKAVYDAVEAGGGATYSGASGITIDSNNNIGLDAHFEIADDFQPHSPLGDKKLYIGFKSVGIGYDVDPRGQNSIAIGSNCKAGTGLYDGMASAAIGLGVKTTNNSEVGLGHYNNTYSTNDSSGSTLFSVGNGSRDDARHNAFEIRQNGDIYITSGGTDILLQDNLGGGGLDDDTQQLIATALVDLHDTKAEVQDVNNKYSYIVDNYQEKGDYATKAEVTSSITSAFTACETKEEANQKEKIISSALNDLNAKFGGIKLEQITQAGYDALVSGGTVDSSTLYIII